MQTCNAKIYDTVTVDPYAYPTQGQSAIYQCDNNGFSLGANVRGGVSPYSYQIIGSNPDTPSIISNTQTSPVFNINTGTNYSLVRTRTIDACGNATLNDVSVLPLQNISISASSNCYYQTVVLSTDTIPTATYQWFRKTSATDSVLIDSGLSHNIPFFVPEQSGQYVCKANVNNGCITRVSYFTLMDNCNIVLPVSLMLNGKMVFTGNELTWTMTEEHKVISYTLERKTMHESGYVPIAKFSYANLRSYSFIDRAPASGENVYRIRMDYANTYEYSNVVKLNTSGNSVVIYPNPANSEVNVLLNAKLPTDFRVQLFGGNGQLIYINELKGVTSTRINYKRKGSMSSGIYLLLVTDINTGKTEIQKILFE
jgi:hypothetical protein